MWRDIYIKKERVLLLHINIIILTTCYIFYIFFIVVIYYVCTWKYVRILLFGVVFHIDKSEIIEKV